jgi:ribosomal protein L11 methyltransferase
MDEDTTHCSSAAQGITTAKTSAKSWVATLTTDEQSARRAASLFAESLATGEIAVSLLDPGRSGEVGGWRVIVHFREPPDMAAIRALAEAAAGPEAGGALSFAEIAAKDWVGESLAGLAPVVAGRFIVHGAHDRGRVAANRIGIEIEAALAFGTGHHGTTRGCLLALDRLCKSSARRPQCILDLGTGSGVLAIAGARALHRRVLATDIDAVAVRAARDNARLNRAGALIAVVQANGVTAPAIRACAPFDLVLANIMLGPLQRLAAPLGKIVAPGGRVVLSGLLTVQANAALAAYRGFALERRIALDGWTTLVLRRGLRRRSIVARNRRRS